MIYDTYSINLKSKNIMTNILIKPSDVLADAQNETTINNIKVRKGTIAALIQNIQVLESNTLDETQKISLLEGINALIPAVVAIGLNDYVSWKNPLIQDLFDKYKTLEDYCLHGQKPVERRVQKLTEEQETNIAYYR